ncbi:MAG TPA: HPr family phosphocarrier protein [Rhodanobacteraceae bacterium]|nr:HPr family phosphocarrier protein [Rhodanobacteraceae bacterium]
MIERDITVTNRLGLHARASAKLVQALQRLQCEVWLISNGREVNAKSIMGVMMLAAGMGSRITLRADGPDEATAIDSAAELFARNFDEGG